MIQDYAQAWNWLKQQVNKIDDPVLHNTMMVEFKKRALRDWGFCPEDGTMATINDVELTPWQQEFLQDIRDAALYQIDTRAEKRAETHKQALGAMKAFIEQGGTLMDIPENIRTDTIKDLFYEAVHQNVDELLEAIDEIDRRDTATIA